MNEQLRKVLDQAALIPARECAQDKVTILLGAIGLELYAAYSKMLRMEVEFRHAPEYLEKGLRQDVEETMEINGETFAAMETKLRNRREELLGLQKGDEAFCVPVGALLEQLAEEMKGLAASRLGEDALAGADAYLEQMREVLAALREYLRLCIGDTTAWERKETGFKEVGGAAAEERK